MLELWIQEFLDETSVVGEEQGTLAVVVEPPSGIHASRETELIECPMTGIGGELAENAEGLVEQNHHIVVVWAKSKAKIRFSCLDR